MMTHGFKCLKDFQRLVAAALAVLCTIGLDSSRDSSAQETVSVGIAGENFSFLPFRVAQEKGLYKKHGLNVRFKQRNLVEN